MSYRRALVTRWSRRDRLAVLVVAVTVAFLTGTVLFTTAVGTQTAAIAGDHDTPGSATYVESPAAATTMADAGEVVVPVAAVTVNGSDTMVVGVPPNATLGTGERTIALGSGGDGTTLGTISQATETEFVGESATVTATVRPRAAGASVFQPGWYVASESTVERLGPTGAFVLSPASTPGEASGEGVPLHGVLAFFVLGTRQALATITVITVAAGLFVGAAVYSVTRMSVRDRTRALFVARATGAPPRHVLGTFAIRGGVLAATGTVLGYAVGVIVAKATVNLAVTAGLPTTLSVGVTRDVMRVLLPVFLGMVGVGIAASLLAAVPTVRSPPARIRDSGADATSRQRVTRWRKVLRPTVLGWRAVAPTAATLTTFVVVAVLVASLGGVVGPTVASDTETVVQAGSTHPFSSSVPTVYADTLRDRGVDASGEIVLLQVVDGQPILARGAEFDAFAAVSDADLVDGRAPRAPNEAVIGADLARSRGVTVGETILLGGSTRPAVTRVRVVGTYAAGGIWDDQLIVPLATARHLRGMGHDAVNLVRADRLPTAAESTDPGSGDGVQLVAAAVSETVPVGDQFTVELTIRNHGEDRATVSRVVRYRDQTQPVDRQVEGETDATVTVRFDAGSPGTYTVEAGAWSRSIRVVPADSLELRGLPQRAPPGSEPMATVVDARGDPVPDATVTVGNESVRTNADGSVRLPLYAIGNWTVEVQAGEGRATRSIQVTEAAPYPLEGRFDVSPAEPAPIERATATLALHHPWNRSLERTVVIASGDVATSRTVTIEPDETKRVGLQLPRRASGTYDVTARTDDGGQLAATTYRVTGDDRVLAAIAGSGRASAGGYGQAVEAAFGNLELLLGGILTLVTVMTVGGTTAAFAGAVHARRRTLGVHRATGRSWTGVLRVVVVDATRIGVVATGIALLAGISLLVVVRELGYLTVFGVQIPVVPAPGVLVGIVVGGLVLAVLGAGLAAVGLLGRPPVDLLAGLRREPETVDR